MDNEEYQDTIEDAQDLQDTQGEIVDAQLDQLDGANYPTATPENNLYSLFWKVVKTEDSTKVANLNNAEIGPAWLPMRSSNHMATLCKTFHHPGLYSFFNQSAENTAATSMSRGGWLGELFVSQKKFSSKEKKKMGGQTEQKWRLFPKKQNTQPAT